MDSVGSFTCAVFVTVVRDEPLGWRAGWEVRELVIDYRLSIPFPLADTVKSTNRNRADVAGWRCRLLPNNRCIDIGIALLPRVPIHPSISQDTSATQHDGIVR